MFGAVIGDIIGSVYEFNNVKSKSFPLWSDASTFTDDTLCTIAIADAMLHQKSFEAALVDWGKRYPQVGYGPMFQGWLGSERRKPYKSWGNGAVMRLSPVCYLSPDCIYATLSGLEATGVTHNSSEALLATEAYIDAFFSLKEGKTPTDIKDKLSSRYGYDMNRSVDDIRECYDKFYVRCSKSVPEAIICALDATGFEDAIRNAISLGGDSDTLATMTGALAEVRFSVPAEMKAQALARLPDPMKEILNEMYRTPRQIKRQKLSYHPLTGERER